MKNVVLDGPTPDTCYLELTQGKQVLVDRADLPLLAEHRWCAHREYRAYRAVTRIPRNEPGKHRQKQVSMHSLLCPAPNGSVVRHLNGDPLDNRRVNLKPGSGRSNQQERHTHLKGRLPGTSFYKKYGNWSCKVFVDGRPKHLGYYETEVESFLIYWAFLETNALDLPDLRAPQAEKLINFANERIRRAYDTPRLRPA